MTRLRKHNDNEWYNVSIYLTGTLSKQRFRRLVDSLTNGSVLLIHEENPRVPSEWWSLHCKALEAPGDKLNVLVFYSPTKDCYTHKRIFQCRPGHLVTSWDRRLIPDGVYWYLTCSAYISVSLLEVSASESLLFLHYNVCNLLSCRVSNIFMSALAKLSYVDPWSILSILA